MKTTPVPCIGNIIRLGIIMFLAGMLGSCEISSRLAVSPASRAPLDYVNWLQTADAEVLAMERERLESALNDPGNIRARIQLALMLSLPVDAGSADVDRAAALLDDAVGLSPGTRENRTTNQYRTLGQIWLSLLQDGREQQDDRRQLEALRQQVQKLQEQIEALTTIEQQLIEREQSQIQTKSP